MRKACLVPLMLFLSSVAAATDFSYSYLQLSGYEAKDNDRDIETSGLGLDLSYESEAGAIIRFAIDDAEIDELRGVSTSNDYRRYDIFFGGSNQYSDKLSLWSGIGLGYEEVETSWTVNNYIYSLGLGARYWVVPRVEINASLTGEYQDFHESDAFANSYTEGTETDVGAELGLRIYPLKQLSIGGSVSGLIDTRTQHFSVDLRWCL